MNDPTPPSPAPEQQPAPTPDTPIGENDLVYVDPDTRTVVGRVQWSRAGNPKSMAYQHTAAEDAAEEAAMAKVQDKAGQEKGKRDREERRRSGRKNYPWGTYRSMRNAYKLEGKKKTEANKTLDEVLEKALKEPFWD